jgi:hypothetical protein
VEKQREWGSFETACKLIDIVMQAGHFEIFNKT